MMMSHVDIPTTPKECLRKYLESLASLLASLNPEIFPDKGIIICLWSDYTGMCFDM